MRKNLFILLLMGFSIFNAQTILFQDDFESHTDFVISGFGNWLTLDLDLLPTYTGGSDTPTWDNAGAAQAFQIFNPTAAVVTNASSGAEVRNFDTHSGSKYAACWAGVPSTSVTANNDWLVSQPITLAASGNSVNFWVKSMSNTYGLERYKVGIYVGSGTPTASSNFTIISTGSYLTAPYPNWEQKTFDLSAYNGQTIRIGINCVSADTYMFMVDDFVVSTTLSVSDIEAGKSISYIYPNPVKSTFQVKLSDDFNAAQTSLTITDLSGKKVKEFSVADSYNISELPKGVYILNVTDGKKSENKKLVKE